MTREEIRNKIFEHFKGQGDISRWCVQFREVESK